MDLHLIWFILLGILLAGYAMLDGFDLGVGILHPLARDDEERRIFISSIGPIWDGNEVWLVTFGGALFAAFPEAYATIFSAFYTMVMLLLAMLILRATSIEFRGKFDSITSRKTWDFVFFASSTLATFLMGVTVGNAMTGITLNSRGEFTGHFSDLLGAYPLMIGLLAVAMFAMQGAIYLYLKVPRGELHERVGRLIWSCWGIFLTLYMLSTVYTLLAVPGAAASFHHFHAAAVVVILNVLAVADIPRAAFLNKIGQAFVASCTAIATLTFLFGIALWPNLLTARNDPSYSLTVYRAASSDKTMGIMLVIACIGIPLVLTYTAIVYWTFRHRVTTSVKGY
jgi:cytochrome d ubiquinol oxidase subunit II